MKSLYFVSAVTGIIENRRPQIQIILDDFVVYLESFGYTVTKDVEFVMTPVPSAVPRVCPIDCDQIVILSYPHPGLHFDFSETWNSDRSAKNVPVLTLAQLDVNVSGIAVSVKSELYTFRRHQQLLLVAKRNELQSYFEKNGH